MRLRLTAIAFGVLVVIAGIVVVEDFPILSARIQRHFEQRWVLGTLIAAILSCIAAPQIWRFRRFWHVWAALAGILTLHFALAVPTLGRLGLIRSGHIEELWLFLLMLVEGAAVHLALVRVTATLPRIRE